MRPDPAQIEVASEEMARVLRAKTCAERLAITFGMFRFARQMIASAVRAAHPDWDEERRNAEVARRISHGAIGPAPVRCGETGKP